MWLECRVKAAVQTHDWPLDHLKAALPCPRHGH